MVYLPDQDVVTLQIVVGVCGGREREREREREKDMSKVLDL